MSSIVISDFLTGYETARKPFLLDNDAFPVLNNGYLFRGQLLRKRGSRLLNRLQRDITGYDLGLTVGAQTTYNLTITLDQADGQIKPSTLVITVSAPDTATFTDNGLGGFTVTGQGVALGSSINYNTGAVVLVLSGPVGGGSTITAVFSYFPNLPVMGLEDFIQQADYPELVAFDTTYSYEVNQSPSPNIFYDVTFYAFSGTPFVWTGADYQQFYSASYKNALWVTNGKQGFHFATITAFPDTAASSFNITLDNPNLVPGDLITFNQVSGTTVTNINGFTGEITVAVGGGVYTVTMAAAVVMTTWASTGIVLLLTASKTSSVNDGIRYYIGDPTTSISLGWVNFNPPLASYDPVLNPTPPYLIGADLLIPFKDRLLFFGVTIATSAAPGGVYYPNRLIYSQNGTPYYTVSNAAPPLPIATPLNEPASFNAWFQNVPAKGGFINAPVQQKIVTVEPNLDVLILGLQYSTMKLIFTGDDSFPFIFQTISSDFGAGHTFSSISLEETALFIGIYGFARCTQSQLKRFDERLPDDVFQISFANNDDKRVTSIRDFRNQFVYFTVSLKNRPDSLFPSKTFLYNYRENNWATFDENYTHYGNFRPSSGQTWATLPYDTWSEWLNPWNYGGQDERFPSIIAGNQQGFVLIKDENITEGNSNYIQSIASDVITSPNHCMNELDYIDISGMTGTVGLELNGTIQQVRAPITSDTFTIDLETTGTYLGGGLFKRINNIDVRTKQFPLFWSNSRKCRIKAQKYLLDNEPDGQCIVRLFTNQTSGYATNDEDISGYSPYTNVLLQGPEPFLPGQVGQDQIWHRVSTSVIGDSVQIGFTYSDAQMRNKAINNKDFALNAIVIELAPAGFI